LSVGLGELSSQAINLLGEIILFIEDLIVFLALSLSGVVGGLTIALYPFDASLFSLGLCLCALPWWKVCGRLWKFLAP